MQLIGNDDELYQISIQSKEYKSVPGSHFVIIVLDSENYFSSYFLHMYQYFRL